MHTTINDSLKWCATQSTGSDIFRAVNGSPCRHKHNIQYIQVAIDVIPLRKGLLKSILEIAYSGLCKQECEAPWCMQTCYLRPSGMPVSIYDLYCVYIYKYIYCIIFQPLLQSFDFIIQGFIVGDFVVLVQILLTLFSSFGHITNYVIFSIYDY